MRTYDHTTWIRRVIDGDADFVNEEWIARAYRNSIAMPGHDPLADLILQHRLVRTVNQRARLKKFDDAVKLLWSLGFTIETKQPQGEAEIKQAFDLVRSAWRIREEKLGRRPTPEERNSR